MSVVELLRRPPARNRLILVGLWAGMWSVAAAAGIRMETFELSMWHFIDPVLLREAPLESLFYLHSQPPLFNALLAAGLALFGDGYPWAFHALFALMALAMVLMVEAMVREGARSSAAGLAAGALLALSPPLVVYAHTLFHALPATFLTVLGVWTAWRAAQRHTLGRFAAFAATVAATALLWAAFHPLWVAGVAAWFVWAMKGARGRACAAMAVPVLLVGALVIKNGVVFGLWGTSSWAGMNLARITTLQIPKAEREALAARGELSPLARVRPFAPLRYYRSVPDPEPTGVPLLDRRSRSNDPRNLHHLKYIAISRGYMRDALTVLRTRPGVYLEAIVKATWVLYLHPADDFHVVEKHRAALGVYARIYDAVVYGRPPGTKRPSIAPERGWSFGWSLIRSGVLLKITFLAVLIGGPIWLRRLWRAGRLREPHGVMATAMAGALLYVTLVCCLLEIGENQRFRFTVEPVAIMAVAMAATAAARRLRRARSRAG